jgi:Mn-dependent DtxR family transcriptional regulator
MRLNRWRKGTSDRKNLKVLEREGLLRVYGNGVELTEEGKKVY